MPGDSPAAAFSTTSLRRASIPAASISFSKSTIAVRALAVLDTKTPEGNNAFSLLILVTSDIPPITLPYNFKLLSVGGLLGLNRTVLLESLAAGIYDETLSSILFPTDIVANAPRIIADLRRVFPAQQGHFLVGPMAKLAWNTPTLLTLDVGLILDLPRPAFGIPRRSARGAAGRSTSRFSPCR